MATTNRTPYIRQHGKARCDAAWALRDRIRIAATRLAMSAPPERWQTIGSGRTARRVLVNTPERQAIINRVNTLHARAATVARIAAQIVVEE
jgi:hypothetical protein